MSDLKPADQVKEALMDFLRDNHGFSGTNFSSEQNLKDAGIDSFKIIELILFMENNFNIKFPEESYTAANLYSVDSIVKCAFRENFR
ncbi:MAG TPA: phosphopantetheine-binding protein [Bacteroidia bacterium]|nr:phosphopantetheine-binding protein [Bacteroidia bacterium]